MVNLKKEKRKKKRESNDATDSDLSCQGSLISCDLLEGMVLPWQLQMGAHV